MAKKKVTYEVWYMTCEVLTSPETGVTWVDKARGTKRFRSAKAAARYIRDELQSHALNQNKKIKYPELLRHIVEDGITRTNSLDLGGCEAGDNILDWFLYA